MGPAGIRCRECAGFGSSPLYQVSKDRLLLGLAGGLAAGIGTGYLLAMLSGLGLFLIWGGILAGGIVGETVLRLTERKRGPKLEILAGVCMGVGAIAGYAMRLLSQGQPIDFQTLTLLFQFSPFYVVSVGLAVVSAVSRIRFL
jgi:hypothetical protein